MNQKELDHLNRFGYVLVESGLEGTEALLKSQKAYRDIYKKAHDDKYPYFRIYYDYFGGKNISGIEMPFHPDIIHKDIVELLNKSNLVKGAKKALGSKDLNLELSRYHMTQDKFGFVGSWHRDAPIGDKNHLQANIFLFDEQGLQILPGTHLKKVPEIEIKLKKYLSYNFEQSLHLKSKAGNILFFNPSMLHRGICDSFRANIHFRFKINPTHSEKIKFNNLVKFNQDWVDILTNKESVIADDSISKYVQPLGFLYFFKKIVKTSIHYLFFFAPYSFFLFRIFSVRPNLKLRKAIFKKI
jgi:hypothetical protein